MPHLVSCTYDMGEVKREKLMREEVDSTLAFLAQRQKRLLRRLNTGEDLAMSPHFNLATGGMEEEEEGHEDEEVAVDSVWNTTYMQNYNQFNSSMSKSPPLQLPPIKGRKQYGAQVMAKTYPIPGPGKLEFATLRARLNAPKGVHIGPLADQLYPLRSPGSKSMVQTSRYDFKLMSPPKPPKKADDFDEEELEPAAPNSSTIRFLGLTLPGMEVPIMSRLNSKFKMPEF